MGTPARKNIIDNLVTTLQGLDGSPYNTDVTTVQALARGYFDVKTGERPFIGVVPGNETHEYQPGDNIYVTFPLSVIAHISGNTLADRQTKINNIIDDIIAVLSVDTTRNANAISTTIQSIQTDEGDPDAHGDGSALIQIVVKYIRTTARS